MEELCYKPDVYEGSDPYICISVHPSDREAVLPVLELLDNRGVRFWTNDGIPPGMDADEVIASHIENSEFFIAFVSGTYFSDLDLVDELNFSRDTGKDYILVYLEDVELPRGLDMRFMRAQSICAKAMTPDAVFDQLISIDGAARFYGIVDEKLRPKAERLFDKLEKLYPEHKVFALDAVDKKLARGISELYIEAGYPSVDRLMLDYGFVHISTEEARILRSSVIYQPGYEPEAIKQRIDFIANRLGEDFPDRTIASSLEQSHKAIYRSLLGLYVWLGYNSVEAMLEAYGFTLLFKVGKGRKEVDYAHVLALLEQRYADRQKPTTLLQMIADNPDLRASLKTMSNRSAELFGMSLNRYLHQKNLVVAAEKEQKPTKTALNRANIIVRIQDLYRESDGSYGTFEDAVGLNGVVLKENIRGEIYAVAGNCSGVLRLPLGIRFISAEAFVDQSDIKELILPPGLTEIFEGAFSDCTGIEKIVFSEGLERIGANAFSGCTSLKSVSFPASLKYIGNEAFADCEQLEEVHFANPRINVQEDAFDGCLYALNELQDEAASPAEYFELSVSRKNTAKITAYTGNEDVVVVPGMIAGHPIVSIEKGCFKDNAAVREIYINDSIEAINGDAFKNCVNLEKIHISNAVVSFTASAFAGCTRLAEANIPDSMCDVPRGLFRDAPLRTVYIGKGVKTLSPDAFYKGIADFGSGLFFKETALENLVIAEENEAFSVIGTMLLSKDGTVLVAELGNPVMAEIPEGVVEIGASAFEKIGSLTQVRFPTTLKKIGEKAFAGTALASVEFADGPETIGMQAFSFCRTLSKVDFCDGLKAIAQQAFDGCPIQDVYIPATVEELGVDSFLAISTYQGQIVQNFRIDSFNPHLIADGVSLYTKTENGLVLLKAYGSMLRALPNAVGTEPVRYEVKPGTTEIAPRAFARANLLVHVELPEGLATIGDMAFWDCKGLTEIHIPAGCEVSTKAFFGINVAQI